MAGSDTDTQSDGVAPEAAAGDDTVDTTEEGSGSEEDGQEDASETLLAGKYKSPEQLEAAYKELERFVGDKKTLEEKASAYDRLVVQQAQSDHVKVQRPKLAKFVTEDGSLDVQGFDAAMEQWESSLATRDTNAASRAAREQVDMERAERDFPYLRQDSRAAQAVISLYRAGNAKSVYDAAQQVDEIRQAANQSGQSEGSEAAKRELSRKARASTVRAGSKASGDGEMTPQAFGKLSLEERKAYINQKFSSGEWKND